MVVTISEANTGYLPAIVMKEILAGRECEITGGVCTTIKNVEDYKRQKPKIVGKFGEIIQWTPSRRALIATRVPPGWAVELLEKVIWDAPAMFRWQEVRDKI